MEVFSLLLWTAGIVLMVNAQQKLVRVLKTEDSKKYCNTWGMYHFKTFDDRNFNFHGNCIYDFSMDCHSEYPYFHITIHRPPRVEPNMVYVTSRIDDVCIVANKTGVYIDDEEFMDYEKKNSVEVMDNCDSLKILGDGITVIWNWGDEVRVELEEQYKDKVCGLCGNYDGNSMNDVQWKGLNVSEVLYGNLNKASDPSGDCPDVVDYTPEQSSHEIEHECLNKRDECESIMSHLGDCKYKMKSYSSYLETCTDDLCKCSGKNETSCLCSNLNQFSKACVEAKGHPGIWRRPDFCYKSCPETMDFFECASPCPNTCSNPMASILCTEQCTEGCSCPPGTFLDDVNNQKKCLKQNHCPCAHNGKIYKPGESYSAACHQCTCIFGQWTCNQVACSGNCTLKGGSHVQTFDEKEYNFHGNCQYLMSKDIDNTFSIIASIRQCGMTETVTCLKAVHIHLGKKIIKICFCGNVFINNVLTVLPKISDDVAIYKRSAFYIYVVTEFGLRVKVQLKPQFQLFISLKSTFQNQTIGLCGNFNGIEGDDLMTISGVVEDAVSSFCNSHKIQASCDDVVDYYDNPCSGSIIKEEYANHWCARVLNPYDVFGPCHRELDPKPYYKHCVYDVCNLENSEEAMCAWHLEYVNECRNRNMFLEDWRDIICDPACPETMVFTTRPRQCNFTCSSLAELDILCNFRDDPREGCTCPEGTYMTPNEKCVPPEDCPCNYKGLAVLPHETFKIDEILCKCIRGILECPKAEEISNVCEPPMYYYDCSSSDPDIVGSQCQKSCTTQDMECYSNECVPGCVCPKGLVSDDNGGCILPSECPCVYGGKFYATGLNIKISCNTCTCKNRTWECTKKHCPKTCTLYGNAHLITFDQYRSDLSGGCDYILAQDFCPNNNKEGTFRISVQNILCGPTNSVCSLKIRITHMDTTIDIYEGRIEKRKKHSSEKENNSYRIDLKAQHIVFETEDVILMYDQKTTIIVQLSNSTEGKVCGICGDNDGRGINDFTSPWSQGCIHEGSRSMQTPCANNLEKLAWAQKHCNLIRSDVFASCHSSVDPIPFYETCVADTCKCNNIGDCECLCTSIAAYATECRRHYSCIKWRTPDLCPFFCDYYNKDGHCDWHYNPCGYPCMKTCRYPEGECEAELQLLEGCFPKCGAERPYFDEENQMCIHVLNCSVCSDMLCDEKTGECLCCLNGKTYRDGELLTEMVNGQQCVSGFCIKGQIAMYETICAITYKTTELPVTPKLTTLSSKMTETYLSKNTHRTLPYTNASTTTSSLSVTNKHSTFLSKTSIQSKSTSQISSPYFKESTTLKTEVTSTTPLLYSNLFSTSRTTTVQTVFSKTKPHITLQFNTSKSTISPPYTKESTTFRTKVTSTTPHLYSDLFLTSNITKLSTSTSTTKSTPQTPLSTSTGQKSTLQKSEETHPITSNDFVTKKENCLMMSYLINITRGYCSTLQAVSTHYCAGSCATSSLYSHDSNSMSRKCVCCIDTERSSRTVDLTCPDGSMKPYTYQEIKKCSCVTITCEKDN